MCLDCDFRVRGLLVRGRNSSEVLDLPGTSLLVKALGVTLLSHLERDMDKNLDEGNGLLLGF